MLLQSLVLPMLPQTHAAAAAALLKKLLCWTYAAHSTTEGAHMPGPVSHTHATAAAALLNDSTSAAARSTTTATSQVMLLQ